MLGQFIFNTCNHAGLNLKALLRNSARSGSLSERELNNGDMHVSLKAFHAGNVVFDAIDFCTIRSGNHVEISEKNCPILADNNKEFTLVAQCKRGDGEQYFPQEHQVIYSKKGDARTTSLVYDQLPVLGAKAKPILLLAPKVWASKDVNTFISFANSDEAHTDKVVATKWKIDLLAQDGKILRTLELDLKLNDVYLLDVKSALSGIIEFTEQLQMIHVVARGESVSCVILTFVQNQKTGALALEHSLSPHYYMNGDFNRVRKEAFLFAE